MKKEHFENLIESANQVLDHATGNQKDLRTTVHYKGYKADVKWSDDDNTFVGRVLDVSDIISFHGDTEEEVKKSFEGMIDFHIELSEKRSKKHE